MAGITRQYGLPFTKTITLPSNKYLHALSGRSVDNICGILYLLVSSISCSNCPDESKESIPKLLILYLTSATRSLLAILAI